MVRPLSLFCLSVGVLACANAPRSAWAQAPRDRYWLEVQAYWPDVNSTVSVATPNGAVGTKIDLESDLALSDRKSTPAFLAGARLSDRFSLIGEYYTLDRSGSKSVGRDITFDDVTYPAGVNVSSAFDTDIYRLVLGYSFLRGAKGELGASLGAHVTQFDIRLAGQGHVGSAALQSQARKRDALAPLPTLGLFGSYEVAPRLRVAGRADYLSLKVGDYDGRLVNTQVSASYRLFQHVALGAMYRYVDYDLNVDKSHWQGEVAYKFKGPALFLQATF